LKQLEGAGEDVCGASMLTGNEVVASSRTRFGNEAVFVEIGGFFVGWSCIVLRCCVHKDQQYKHCVKTRERPPQKTRNPPRVDEVKRAGAGAFEVCFKFRYERWRSRMGAEAVEVCFKFRWRRDCLFSSRLSFDSLVRKLHIATYFYVYQHEDTKCI
jgi:hypothetical protein